MPLIVGGSLYIFGVFGSSWPSAESVNYTIVTFGDSSRVVGLVQLLLKSNAANSLVEDYAACLEVRSEECQIIENKVDDPGVLIMQASPATALLPASIIFNDLY
jgi:hypothetical protein